MRKQLAICLQCDWRYKIHRKLSKCPYQKCPECGYRLWLTTAEEFRSTQEAEEKFKQEIEQRKAEVRRKSLEELKASDPPYLDHSGTQSVGLSIRHLPLDDELHFDQPYWGTEFAEEF